jgi:hypothetical protein
LDAAVDILKYGESPNATPGTTETRCRSKSHVQTSASVLKTNPSDVRFPINPAQFG